MKPMLATTGPLPCGSGWAYELDWGGVRALVDVGPDVPGGLSVTGDQEEDLTATYPELAGLTGVVRDALLDGQVVSLVDRRAPVTYLAFDVLRLYGVDVRARPYRERRATLERLRLDSPYWTVPPVFDDGEATGCAARQHGLGGVVAKRLDSTYRDGARTTEWVSVPLTRQDVFRVVGWQWGQGERAGGVGALLVGQHRHGRLRYAGLVREGLHTEALRELIVRLVPLRRDNPPFDGPVPDDPGHDVVWCSPTLVVRVAFPGWTPDGLLRRASFQGLGPTGPAGTASGG